MQRIKTKSFDLAIYAKGEESSKKLALVLPGKLDTKDYPHMKSHVDFLATQGFFALSFDPPGSWESKGDISLYTMTNYLKAIDELIEYFGNKPTVLLGHSRGGTIAMVGGKNPKVSHFIAIMSRAGESVGRPGKPGEKSVSYRDIPGKTDEKIKFELPYSYFDDSACYDVIEALKQSAKPKLFILGTKDKTIKPDEVRAAYEAAAEPKEICEIDSDHDYRQHPDLIQEVNRILGDFIKRNP